MSEDLPNTHTEDLGADREWGVRRRRSGKHVSEREHTREDEVDIEQQSTTAVESSQMTLERTRVDPCHHHPDLDPQVTQKGCWIGHILRPPLGLTSVSSDSVSGDPCHLRPRHPAGSSLWSTSYSPLPPTLTSPPASVVHSNTGRGLYVPVGNFK